MMSLWHVERLAELRMQDYLREAAQERLIRQVRGANAHRTAPLPRLVAWLNGRFLAPTKRRQERCCADAGLGPSQCESHGSLIL
jgi:hypothetical protein